MPAGRRGILSLDWCVIPPSLGQGGGCVSVGQRVARAPLMAEPFFSSFGLSRAFAGLVRS